MRKEITIIPPSPHVEYLEIPYNLTQKEVPYEH